tara:strand:- start:1558 stop:1674 length:117 start_codon:yes stop_codon:yes gene_type:complete
MFNHSLIRVEKYMLILNNKVKKYKEGRSGEVSRKENTR